MRVALRRVVGCLALLVFSGSLGLPLLASGHLLAGLDPDCASPLVAAGRQAGIDDLDQTRAQSSAHCVLCHWLRAVSSATPALVAVPGPQFVTGTSGPSGLTAAPRDAILGDAASRAPPSHTLS